MAFCALHTVVVVLLHINEDLLQRSSHNQTHLDVAQWLLKEYFGVRLEEKKIKVCMYRFYLNKFDSCVSYQKLMYEHT